MEKQKVIVYVDGFNFYYGLKHSWRWRRYYWLDMVRFFELGLKENQELVAVKYFSAIPDDEIKQKNQDAFFQANKQNAKFQLILGKYLRKEIICRNCGYTIRTYEEKESDVRIATQIVSDAYKKNCDISIVVSADSDMIPAVELAMEAKHRVFVYFPPNHYSSDLNTITGGAVFLSRYEKRFKQSLLPDVIHLEKYDYDLHIPEKWKQYRNTK